MNPSGHVVRTRTRTRANTRTSVVKQYNLALRSGISISIRDELHTLQQYITDELIEYIGAYRLFYAFSTQM